MVQSRWWRVPGPYAASRNETAANMSSPDEEHPSTRLVQQRTRNRMIDFLEWVSSYDEQRKYQRAAYGFLNIPHEVFREHETCFFEGATYDEPIFTPAERAVIISLNEVLDWVWDDSHVFDDFYPDLEDLIGTEDWEQLRAAAERALSVFQQRGRLPDDEEIA